MAHRSSPAPFLTKTYQLVHDPDTDDVISWSVDGAAFVVWKIAEFAKDVLPKYFKHNNFSSFVRQLNTYGFRKTVPEKWEFFNEHFKRGQKDILSEIRRRKTAQACVPAAKRPGSGSSSPSSSGEDLGSGSTSTSSPTDTKSPPGSVGTRPLVPVPDLSEENEKLKRDNESLSTELATAKKQCEELVAFLTGCVKAGPHQGDRIMCGGPRCTGSYPSVVGGEDEVSDDEYGKEESGERLKLFGVWLKGDKKRGREEKTRCRCGFGGPREKEMRMEFGTRWMRMQLASPPPETSKVCN